MYPASPAAALCFGSMLQIDWQEEARRARRLWAEAHKQVPAEVTQHAGTGTDVEQPATSSLAPVSEHSGAILRYWHAPLPTPNVVLQFGCRQVLCDRSVRDLLTSVFWFIFIVVSSHASS